MGPAMRDGEFAGPGVSPTAYHSGGEESRISRPNQSHVQIPCVTPTALRKVLDRA
jgi:hypothetical protein